MTTVNNKKSGSSPASPAVTFPFPMPKLDFPIVFGTLEVTTVPVTTLRNQRRRANQKARRAAAQHKQERLDQEEQLLARLLAIEVEETFLASQREELQQEISLSEKRVTRNQRRRANQKARKDDTKTLAALQEVERIVKAAKTVPRITRQVKRGPKPQVRLTNIDRKTFNDMCRAGFIPFHELFPLDSFTDGWEIVGYGTTYDMVMLDGYRWCISRQVRNRRAHSLNGNGNCFSPNVTVNNTPEYNQGCGYYSYCCDCPQCEAVQYGTSPPRSNERKVRNKKAHSDNGNGTSENMREAQNEVGRDIESTLVTSDRSNTIDIQAMKPTEEPIPQANMGFTKNNINDIVLRRTQLRKFTLTSDTVPDTQLEAFDPFKEYYNLSLAHNSSMATFRDASFDLKIEVIIQSLPSIAGILHFAFDRFAGGLTNKSQMFALPNHMVDLSAKDSLEFVINMDLPYRVMNTLSTPYAGSGCGSLFAYLATRYSLPETISSPVTVTIFGTPVNFKPFNLKPRASVRLEAALVPLDRDSVQNITQRNPASNRMSPVEIAGQWGFVSRTPLAQQQVEGQAITQIHLHPTMYETPLKHVARAYSYYRGGMRVKITMNLSKFQNFTMAAVWVPTDAPFDPAKYDAYAFTEIMFDEKHEAIVDVEYGCGSNWLPVYVGPSVPPPGIDQRAESGVLHLIVRSPLVSTVTYASQPEVLVQIAAAEDFEVAHPRDSSKNYFQPPILQASINPEVPRQFRTASSNLYEDARLPVLYTRLELSEVPYMIPVTATRGNAGVMGLLKNTHAGWSGSLDYFFVFEGTGQAEIRYDPTKRFANNAVVIKGKNMPTSGYCKFMNTRTNPHTQLSVPFCSLYDYLPTRAGGAMRTLTNGNCNGGLFIAGKGTVRVYRSAGIDFKVHMYNSFDDLTGASEADEVYTGAVSIGDPLEDPAKATIPYIEAGLFGIDAESINATTQTIAETVPFVRSAVERLQETAEAHTATVDQLRDMIPEIREMLYRVSGATDTAHRAADSVCDLISGNGGFGNALLTLATGGIRAVKAVVLAVHGLVQRILNSIAPEFLLRFFAPSFEKEWTANELTLLYGVVVTAAAMSIGVDNTFAIVSCIAVVGLAVPVIKCGIESLTDYLFGSCFTPAEKKPDVRMEAPSAIACGASLLTSIITFFIPNNKLNLHATSTVSKDVAGIFSGAKAIDEMLSGIMPLILNIPGVSNILGSQFKTVSLLAEVDVQAFVDEVKDLMTTDFFNEALTNEKVRQQEKLWMIHKKLDKALPETSNKTNFFFNTALRKVMDEQHKMYKHCKAFKGAGRERFPPFVLMIGGETRVGKSYMTAHMQTMLCDMMNWDADTDIYTRQPTDPYFTGLANQKIFYVDDLHTNITTSGADSDMAMIMSFATNAPWAPRMAAIEDKGRTVNSLIGIFCTNTMGEPTFPGIRNVPAYLARRHMCVMMERKKNEDGTPVDYAADYSHARFFLIDPLDREGMRRLDRNGKPCEPEQTEYYDFKQLWSMLSNRFINHLIKERVNRAARKNASTDMPMPDVKAIELARKLADHYDDVDYVTLDEIEVLRPEGDFDLIEAGIRLAEMGGSKQRYLDILKAQTAETLDRAYGDIVYVPAEDSFIWFGKKDENSELYFQLMHASGDTEWHEEELVENNNRLKSEIRNLTQIYMECESQDEEDEFLSCVDAPLHDVIKRGAIRRRDLLARAKEIDMAGKRGFKEMMKSMYDCCPRWLSVLAACLSVGGVIFYTVNKIRSAIAGDSLMDAVRGKVQKLVEPQYSQELAPAIHMQTKKTVLSVPKVVEPQYAKELAPAITENTKRKMLQPQYAKELAPAITQNTKRKMLSPQVDIVDEEDASRLAANYRENPRATTTFEAPLKLESAAQFKVAREAFAKGRLGRIRRGGMSLNFYWLEDDKFYCNRHFWTVMGGVQEGDVIELFWRNFSGENQCVAFNFQRNRAFCIRDTDHAGYVLPQRIQGIRKGWDLLATEAEVSGAYPDVGMVFSCDKDDLVVRDQTCPGVKRRLASQSLATYINLDGSMAAVNHTGVYIDGYSYAAVTGAGACGSLLVFPHEGGKIFATHTSAFEQGKDKGLGLGQYISKEIIKDMFGSREPLFPTYDSIERLPAPVFDAREQALNVVLRLEVGYEPMIDMTPYGLEVVKVTSPMEAVGGSMPSKYRKSPLDDFFPDEPFKVPAITMPGDTRAPYKYDPRPDIMGKYNKVISPLPEKEVAMTVEHLTTQFQGLHHPFQPDELLDFEKAVNGVPNCAYYDAINFHTSPGLPYSLNGYHKKSALFCENGTYSNGQPIRECIVPALESRFNQLIAAAKSGDMLEGIIFQEFMKDELLKRKKVYEVPATRGIANPPLDLLLAERAAFLPFIALMQYNRHEVDCQVGINALSGLEWSEMIHRLKENSDLVFDADYTAFDSTIHPSTLDAWADIVNGTMGGSEATRRARRTLIRYSYDRVAQVTNVQVKINQGMASGMPFTAVGNSGCNSIYLRVAWLMLAKKHSPQHYDLRAFDKNVRCIVYGDDNVVTVKAQVAQWFNLRAIALELEPFGILMTDGAKNPRHMTQPFSNWDDVRFLKRAFKKDDATGLYLAPLDKKTIIDRVRYVKSKCWWPDLEMRIEMSLVDCMMHGEEYFEAFKFAVNSMLKEIHLPVFTVGYVAERTRWEIASNMLALEVGNELTFARQNRQGTTEVFFANDDLAPTFMGGQFYLRLDGPRAPIGNEAQTLEIWQSPRTTIVQRPPTTPPTTSTGGVTLAQLQNEFNTRPAGVTLQQLQQELNNRPTSSGGLSLAQLQNELNARQQLNGVTQPEMVALLQQLQFSLRGDLIRELDARPCRSVTVVPPAQPPTQPPAVGGGFVGLRSGASFTGALAMVEFSKLNGVVKRRAVTMFYVSGTQPLELTYQRPGKRPRTRRVLSASIEATRSAEVRYGTASPLASHDVIKKIPISQRRDYKVLVDRLEGDLRPWNPQLGGYGTPDTMTHDGLSDVHNWRQPTWLSREQLTLFGNYIRGLETCPIPRGGGFTQYAPVFRNFRKIQEWMEKQGLQTLKGQRVVEDDDESD
jgi:hypothetical protein